MLKSISPYQNGNRLLEVGSNIGFTLNLARSKGYDVEGCEVNKSCRRFCENTYRIRAHNDLFKLTSSYDIVIMNDVLEHFTNPLKALQKIYELLQGDGVLFIQLPNAASKKFQHKKENWKYLSVPDHTFHFTTESLKMIANQCGFEYRWHRTVDSIEDFALFEMLPSKWPEKILSFLHTNPWYWPGFYKQKKDGGPLIQMIFVK
jgi:2-polyprenyl-3-methyl-5-hydroxy-6-metoxy-1,4-benzoquinol methylase